MLIRGFFSPIAFKEIGKEKQKHNKCKREASVGCLVYAPGLGIEPTTWVHALTGNQIHNPSVTGQRFNQLSHASQGTKATLRAQSKDLL